MEKCLTCKHWEGDKVLQRKMIKETGPKCMDLKDGWPLYGLCKIGYDWLDVSVHGDASFYCEVASGFGCILHESENEDA